MTSTVQVIFAFLLAVTVFCKTDPESLRLRAWLSIALVAAMTVLCIWG